MFKITKDSVFLTRGDTALIEVELLNEDGEEYTPESGDHLYFRLKQSTTAKVILIEKEIDMDTMVLELTEDDTKDLKFAVYKYEIELVTANNYHFTVIANADFEIGVELEIHNG